GIAGIDFTGVTGRALGADGGWGIGCVDASAAGSADAGSADAGSADAGSAGSADAGGAGGASAAGTASGGGAARGTGIASLTCADTIACRTFGVAAPRAGVRRDGRGLRSSLTAGA